MGNKMKWILVLLIVGLNLTGCSRNKIEGLPDKVMLGTSYEDLNKKYTNQLDGENDRFFITDSKLGNLNCDFTCKKDENSDSIKEIEANGFGHETSKKDILKEFINLYGEPIHQENYNDQTTVATDVWNLRNDNYLFLEISDYVTATYKTVSSKTIDKQKEIKKKRDKLLKTDSDLKKVYDEINKRSLYDGRNISAVIKDFDSKFDYYYYTWINSSSGEAWFEDTFEAGKYKLIFKYKYQNPYVNKYYKERLGTIDYVSCSFDKTGNYKSSDKLLEALFGAGKHKDKWHKEWKYSPCDIRSNGVEDYGISKSVIYSIIEPKFNNTKSLNKVNLDEEATEQTLLINEDEIYITLDDYDDKYNAISCAQKVVKERLKSPSSASFCSSSECKGYRKGKKVVIMGYVDAENSFGAKVRTNYTVSLNVNRAGNYTLDNVYFPKY